jgi:hypothetical protein
VRALILTFIVLAVAAPAARAEGLDFLPVYGANDGVRLTPGAHARFRFGRQAARLYREFAGQRAYLACKAYVYDELGDFVVRGRTRTFPVRRSTVRVSTGDRPDVCALATPPTIDDRSCRLLFAELPGWCARAIVAVTPLGRTTVDRLARSVELTAAEAELSHLTAVPDRLEGLRSVLDADVVGLASPDASPPPGKLGVYGDPANHTVAALQADGTRVFLRREGDVISTNVGELLGRALTVSNPVGTDPSSRR